MLGGDSASTISVHHTRKFNDSDVKLDDKKELFFRLKVKFFRGTFEILIFNIFIILINSRSSKIDINGDMLPPSGRKTPLQITIRIWNLSIQNHPVFIDRLSLC